jgi:hypothetical protein
VSDETKAPEEAVESEPQEAPEKDSVANSDAPDLLDQHIINPMTELIRSMKTTDETCRTLMAGLKRLFKQSKGRGQVSLTEIMQMFSALYSLHHLGQNQALIVSNQVTTDLDRQRLHLRAIQEFVIEEVVEKRGVEVTTEGFLGDDAEERYEAQRQEAIEAEKQKCRDRIDELFAVEKEKMAERRKAAVEKHKDSILDGALKTMQRPALQKEEKKEDDAEEGGSKIIALP